MNEFVKKVRVGIVDNFEKAHRRLSALETNVKRFTSDTLQDIALSNLSKSDSVKISVNKDILKNIKNRITNIHIKDIPGNIKRSFKNIRKDNLKRACVILGISVVGVPMLYIMENLLFNVIVGVLLSNFDSIFVRSSIWLSIFIIIGAAMLMSVLYLTNIIYEEKKVKC